MKERPILFSAPMVRAILDGRKTQTRRVIVERKIGAPSSIKRDGSYIWALFPNSPFPRMEYQLICPFGQPGDRLWVREAHALVPRTAYAQSNGVQQPINPDDNHDAAIYREGWDRSHGGLRWRPSIHMPRWASRITLEITGVRVERVQQITTRDISCEGRVPLVGEDAREHWAHFWNVLNMKRGYGWETNPWVWVIEFKRVEELQAAA